MGSIEADGLLRLMTANQAQNRVDIDALKKGQDTIKDDMATLTGEISGGVKVLKFIGWVIVVAMTGLGVWFASLEARGKVSDNKPPAALSSTHPQPTDATLPPTYQSQR